jgi:1-deoxy-D-xylulose-5-phosphate reductoisomerase
VLGSTGSIGTNTLDVIRQFPESFELVGISAHSNGAKVVEQAREFQPRYVVISDAGLRDSISAQYFPTKTELLWGQDALVKMVQDPVCDIVVSAIVGAAGLFGTWAALDAGKTVALANKETLVVAGPLVMDLVRKKGGTLLPVDSEHSAIFQALSTHTADDVKRIVLTGSGGPFRGRTTIELEHATIEDALKHPTWKMGRKITIDSATLMNKALEVIEARWLFGLSPEQIDVIIHPESIVHSFVEFVDGSVMAQLSPPDMRLPIQYALTYPNRWAGPAKRLDWAALRSLCFEKPDTTTFAALNLGFEVARRGGTSGAVLNAANETAVARFLEGSLRFLDIARACEAVLAGHHFIAQPTLDELLAADRWARLEVTRWTRL